MPVERFEISFHGPAVENHSMNAKDLGRTMIATGELVEKISAQLLPDDSVDLYVRATRPGSFEIIFEWINENRDVIIETLRLLFNLYKDWKVTPARGPSTAEKVGPNIHIHYHYHLLGEDDSDQYRIRPQPLIISESVFLDLVSPLNKEGVNRMDMSRDGEPLESIDEDAVKNFHRNILTERNPAVRYAGEEFDLTPENVLKIPGPQDEMRGPHRVVHIQNTEDRWALVTLEWWIDDLEAWKPCLGLRWFHGNSGYPVAARGWARWMVIPSELSRGILDTLPLYPQDRAEIDAFLAAEWAEE